MGRPGPLPWHLKGKRREHAIRSLCPDERGLKLGVSAQGSPGAPAPREAFHRHWQGLLEAVLYPAETHVWTLRTSDPRLRSGEIVKL